jgi:hypothetical protein
MRLRAAKPQRAYGGGDMAIPAIVCCRSATISNVFRFKRLLKQATLLLTRLELK